MRPPGKKGTLGATKIARAGRSPAAVVAPRSIRKGYWIIGGVAVYAFTTYGTYLYRSYHDAVAQSQKLEVPEDVSSRYDVTASTFDRDVGCTEWLMGLGRLRKKMARRASGDVLEVSAGTGRNLPYYPWDQCERLTLVDKSRPMLEQARNHFLRTSAHGTFWGAVRDVDKPLLTAFGADN